MNLDVTRDRVTLLGTLVGVGLAVVVLATLAGQPWRYVRSTGVAAVQLVAAVLALGIAVGTVRLALRE